MAHSGSASFHQYAQGYLRLRALEAELAQKLDLQRAQFRASLIETPNADDKADLSCAFAFHRHRSAF